MDKEFGGARPKLKTFRRDQDKPETDRNSIASQESAENDATTSELQNTSTLFTEKEAPGDMFFKEDHFTEEEFNVEQEICSHSDPNKRGTGSHGDRQFVGEYLPLTNRLINNAIRGTCLNAPSQSKKQQSASCNDKYMNQFKGLDACEPKKTESSARDRWKKSGVALRNYLLSKFGYRADKEEKVTPCLTCFPNMNSPKATAYKQSEHYSDDRRNCHLSQTCQKCLESDHPSKPANRKSDKQGKTPSNHAGKSLKIQKGKRSNCQRKEVLEKENSDTNLSSGPSPYNSVPETDSGSVNSDWTINSNLTNGKQRVCECRPAMNNSSDRKCSCDWSLESHDQKKKSSHKDKSFLHEMQKAPSVKLNGKLAKKKSWVGLLDHVLTSSTDTDCDEFISSASYAKRRRRKSNSRNSTRSYHGDNETEADSHLHSSISTENPERTVHNDLHSEEVGQKLLPSQQKDILCELKYALPYLPEKLRRRLYSTPAKQDKKQPSSEIEFSTPSESNIRSKSRFLVDDFDKETIALKERCANTYGKVCDMDSKEKYQCFIDSDNCTENKTVGNSDSGDEDVLPTAMKTRDSDVKFHLNDSGTWTMTNFGDSESDHENINQDHLQRCWSPLTGQLAGMARYGHGHWLDHEIVQLEASLEDPFNVRGDNLILNSSPTNMIKFDEDLGSDLEDKSEGHPHRFSSSFAGQLTDNARYQHADWLDYDIVQPEDLLEDPFNIRGDKPILYYSPKKMNSSLNSHQETECEDILTKDHERCSSSMHLDEPYVNIETDEHKSCNSRLSSRLGRNIPNISKTRSNRSYSNLYDSSFGFLENDIHSSAKLNVSDVTKPETGIAQHKPQSPCSSNRKQDDDSGRKVDNSVDYSNSFGIGGDYSTWTKEESEIKGDNSVDDLCSGLSKIPLSADNLGRNAVSHSSTLDDLNMSRSWKTFSQESDLDADDEFECDCEYCISLRQLSMNQSGGLVIDVARQQSSPVIPDEFDAPIDNLSVPGPDLDIGISELMSLDFVVSETNRDMGLGVMLENVILQLLMDNVIMQMVNVRPDLMSDPTPPPATESVIDNIPTICLSQQDIDQNPVCPICLCPSALGETMSRLPCQHIFHPLCVQAWLVKSGTCPVCRHRL